ncbi:MAG: AAA family ATPase [Pseudomonadota bacterium]|nr:AAA family ATPase [Pseudomonadota bacterium]
MGVARLMIRCPKCSEENPPRFRLCGYCGAPLVAVEPLPAHEVRKTVTLIFSDLKDSTALGERLDSEALHEVKERYFTAMAAEIKRHGGKIEKYIGDAIMAVFGLPRAREDDALRAVRAAIGMKTVLSELNVLLSTRFGVVLANRTGVNTGKVVAIDDPSADQKLATGDAVNVTARLEQAAPANEIYIGEVTYRLVRDAVEVEAVEPLTLKGKSQPVAAYRLISVHGQDGNVRRVDTPLVGRDTELVGLNTAWDTVRAERHARLVTVIGDAGIGKSRLVRELMDRVGSDARIVCGRCLAYGDGITFWPLREMVVSTAGIHRDDTPDVAREKLLACTGDAAIADRMASATGLSATPFPLHEIYWGARRFMQVLAMHGPLLALFDDIHWAEPAFLDLLENLLQTIGDSPVLLLTTARRDLLEERPQWGERERSTRVTLSPLGDAAAAQVVTNLLGAAGLPAALQKRIVDAAEGNPLYVEQMLSMLIDTGVVRREGEAWVSVQTQGDIAVPPTIQALLEARLDNLQRSERAAAEPAAVIGMEFPQPAVESLTPPPLRDGIEAQLAALSRKHFIRPMSSDSGSRYRFDHHLVRDTVYNGLLKRSRATLHTEFVRWADQDNAHSDRGREFEEILGYHLEQAYRYLGELGPIDEAGVRLGRDAAHRLSSAGRRAFARGDMHAAAKLFGRAVALLADNDPQRVALLPELGETLTELGDFGQARTVLEEALVHAERLNDTRLKAAAMLLRMQVRLYGGEPGDWGEQTLRVATEAVAALETLQADAELAIAWRLIGYVHGVAGRYGQVREAATRLVTHARRAGNERLVARTAVGLSITLLLGPTPVPDAIAQCERIVADGLTDRQALGKILCTLATLRAMNGEFDLAREHCRRGRELLRELGQGWLAASTAQDLVRMELLAGNLASAEREAREDYAFLSGMGETYQLATLAALLSRVVRDLGRDAEALEFSVAAEAAAGKDDIEGQALWRSIRAPILARAGELEDAVELARAALKHALATEISTLHADTRAELAHVLNLCHKQGEARQMIGEAIALYEAKGDKVSAARWHDWAARTLTQSAA